MRIKISNIEKIEAVLNAVQRNARTGTLNHRAVWKAAEDAEHQIAPLSASSTERRYSVLDIYPARRKTGTHIQLVRGTRHWFLTKVERCRGTAEKSGIRLHPGPMVRFWIDIIEGKAPVLEHRGLKMEASR